MMGHLVFMFSVFKYIQSLNSMCDQCVVNVLMNTNECTFGWIDFLTKI